MKKFYLASAAALALSASGALADGHIEHLFPVGEGDFNWDSYNAYADAFDLSGQELTITGPWDRRRRGTGERGDRLFRIGHRRDRAIFRL